MKLLFLFTLITSLMANDTLFDFTENANLQNWTVVDDVVMGGRSSSTLSINKEGHGIFSGKVSLENNGGFSSIRYRFNSKSVNHKDHILIKVRGDGKNYQFRVKTNASDYYSYISSFNTSGEWEEIRIPLEEMYPSYRGRILDQANFSDDHIEEIAILIGNKKEESFQLLIDKIELIKQI